MATTNFVGGTTLTAEAWFDDTDTAVYSYLTSPSGTNTITATGPASMTAYAAGQLFRFIPANTNTGATTINITPSGSSALGAKNIFAYGAACNGSEIIQNIPAYVMYDGTQFNLINPQSSGRWLTPTFSAGDFTSSAGTWTVEAGDVTTYAYTINGKMMTVAFNLVSTAPASVAMISLYIKIPASKTATKTMATPIWIDDNTSKKIGYAIVTASNTKIDCRLMDDSTWAIGGSTGMKGEITFEIN